MSELRPAAIVVAHGDLAQGLVSAVQAITGRGATLYPLSNSELGRDGLEAALEELLDRLGVDLVFTDLPGGSCALSAQRLARVHPELRMVTGVSLPMLLHFAMHAGEPGVEQAALERAIAAMRVYPEAARAG